MTQLQRVVERIKEADYIDNVWAFEHHILRLGAIIFNLKRDGWQFRTEMDAHNNCHYYLIGRNVSARVAAINAMPAKKAVEPKPTTPRGDLI